MSTGQPWDRRAFLGLSAALALPPLAKPRLASAVAPAPKPLRVDLAAMEKPRLVRAADRFLPQDPFTITAKSSPRSAGGKHDFFSEGDYWWPDPKNPNGPYIQRDGMSNPDNFVFHRQALMRLSVHMPVLTAAWQLTGNKKYAQHAIKHLRAWFIDPETIMNPHLRYAQAIKNVVTGRSIGVIDTIHLVEVARAASVLDQGGAMAAADRDGVKKWFKDYLTWITTHEYGTKERDAENNHGTCWVMQAAEFARYTGNQEVGEFCRERFKKVLLPNQMAPDGSFPRELKRTKPYGYSLFQLDALAIAAQTLSTPADNLWTFELPDGRGLRKALEFIWPFVEDKKRWPHKPDVMYFDEWPIRHPALIFGGLALGKREYVERWKALVAEPDLDEVIRNFPVRVPVLWVEGASRPGARRRRNA